MDVGSDGDGGPRCSKHDRLLEYFCKDDQEAICSRCYIMGDHKDHSIESFEEKNKSIVANLENGMEAATVVYNKLSKLDKKFVVKQLNYEKAKLVENVTQTFTSIHVSLKQREAEILTEIERIYTDCASSTTSLAENAKNDKHKLEKALVDCRSLLENRGLIIDGEALLATINRAPEIPCILSEQSTAYRATWDKTHMEDIVDAINSFGTIKSVGEESVWLKTVEEAPETIKDSDRVFQIPFVTQRSFDAYSISSAGTGGDDVIIESDSDSISTALSSISNNSFSGKEIVVPQVKGQCKQVAVTHIRSPNDFYIQLLVNRNSLEKLSGTINAWCRKKSSVQHIPDVLERGMLVLACYSVDKQWYRARVLDVKAEMKAHIMYFDFGNEEEAPLKSLRKMEPRFSRYPPFCFHCSLYDIAPLNNRGEWERHCIQEFLRLTRNQVLLLNTIAVKGLTYEVDLVCTPAEDVLDDQFSSVRDMLIFLDLAKFARPSQSNDGKPPSYKTVDYFKTTPLAIGELVEVSVSEASSPSNFYIMPDGEEKLYYLNMMEEMNEVYSKDGAGIYMMHCPRKDTVCAVKGPDNQWHRGKIISKPKHSKVTVFLVDRGSTLVVHYDKIKKLLSDFIKLPSLAVHCILADVGYTDVALGDWTDDAKVWCRTDLKGAQGIVRIVRWGEQAEVVLWMGSNVSGPSVNSLLVKAELATSIGLSSLPAVESCGSNNVVNDVGHSTNMQEKDVACKEPQSPTATSSSSSLTVTNSPTRSSHTVSPSKTPQTSPPKKKTVLLYKSPPVRARNIPELSSEKSSASLSSSSSSAKAAAPSKSVSSDKASSEKSSSSTRNAKLNKDKKGKRRSHRRSVNEDNEEEEDREEKLENVKDVGGDKFVSAEQTARKKKVQEDIHKAIGGGAAGTELGSGDGKKEGDSIYIEILVGCYKSPTDFFIRVKEQEKALLDLMEELNEEYQNSAEMVQDQTWNATDFCVVRCPGNEQWYRAKITSILSASDVEVELLDYGDSFHASTDDLRPLARDLGSKLRRAAVRCHLAGLIPTGSSDRSKWSKTATEFMENIISTKKLYIKTEDDPCESGLPIDIIVEEEIPETPFDPVTFTYHSLRQKMMDQGLAMFDKPRKRASESVSSSIKCEVEEVTSEKQQIVQEQPPSPSQVELPPYEIPALNSQLEVIPTFVDFGGVIYTQQVEWDAKVAHLSQELQRVYKDSPKSHRRWSLGDVCVALFVDDGLWYRGLIEEMDGNKAKVFYVDFGNSAWMSCDQLRELRGPFAQYHVQVYHCVLEDLAPNTVDGSWPVPVLDVVHEMVVNCPCTMTYKGMMDNGHLKIALRKPDGFDLATNLLENGFAVSTADLKDRYGHSQKVARVLKGWTGAGLSSNPDLEAVGSVFRAVATEVELPDVIYLQRTRLEEAGVHDFVRASEIAAVNQEIEQFEQMMEEIKTTPSSGFIKLPHEGMMCLAKYHFDNKWYRALCVEQVAEMDSALVIFSDYGTSELVSKDCLRTLPSQFWDLPSQGIRCHVNVIPPGGPSSVWKKNSLDAMVAALNQKSLTVKVAQSSPLVVDLFVETEGGELNLAYEEMIQKGLAWLPMQINADELMMGGGGGGGGGGANGVTGRRRDLSDGGSADVEVEDEVEDESGYVGSEAVGLVVSGDDGCAKEAGAGDKRSVNNSYDEVEEVEEEHVVMERSDQGGEKASGEERLSLSGGKVIAAAAALTAKAGVASADEVEEGEGIVGEDPEVESGDGDGDGGVEEEEWATTSEDDEGSAV